MGDFRYAIRGLLRTPGFTIAAVLALALGIGATTAIFSVVHAVLLRPLGWADEGRLLAVHSDFPGHKLYDLGVSPPEFYELRKAGFVERAGAYRDGVVTLGGDRPERLQAGVATDGFFETLGVQPALGRTFTPAENLHGNDRVALLSWDFFQSHFAGDPQTVGKTITLEQAPYTVIGVLPRGFRYREPQDVFVPHGWEPGDLEAHRVEHYLHAVVRLRPGVTLEAAKAQLDALTARIRADHTDTYSREAGWRFAMKPLRTDFVGPTREPLLLLFGAVVLVLLIACANVANLLLARSASRGREFAVRAAIGASRARLVRQLLVEGLVLAACGAALGVATAAWAMNGILALAPESVRSFAQGALNLPVLAFAGGLAMATTLLFALTPALRASTPDLATSLKDGSASGPPSSGRARSALVAGQVALSMALLAAAALVLRSFGSVLQIAPGFDAQGVLTARLSPSGDAYDETKLDGRIGYYQEALRRVAALPGVQSAGAVDVLPLTGSSPRSYRIEGYQPAPGEPQPAGELRWVDPGYFRTLRIPLASGRELTDADDFHHGLVALVSEAWVRRYFPGRVVVGRRLRFPTNQPIEGDWRTIVGVVADVRELGLDKPPPPIFYLPQAQRGPDTIYVVVRGTAAPAAVRAALASADPSQAVDEIRPLEDVIAASLAPRKFPLELLGLFALLALALSALGIYGVTAYAVSQRTREIGLRIAVGASAPGIVRMILAGSLRTVAIGLAAGGAAAMAGGALLSSQLYGVGPRDPLTYAAVAAVLLAVALLASALPALRAARVDPMIALRAE